MKFDRLLTAALAALPTVVVAADAPARADAHVESAIKKSFVYRHLLKGDDVKVQSRDGVVTLTGSVSEKYHKTLAREAAAAQDGVTKVDDRVEVTKADAETGSDAWLSGKVKTALLFHRNVSAVGTKIEAKGGVVTLSGRADNQAQKDLTTEYARDVDGVNDVRNEMTVAGAPAKARRMEDAIDDASVTAEVKMTLLLHRSTSALDTRVRTKAGVVVLGGKAKSAAEKDLAEKIVKDLKGVKGVRNDIVVE